MANGTVIRAADYLTGSKSAGINEAIAANRMCGPRTNVPTVLELPAGIHEVSETIVFGGPVSAKSTYGIVVRGWGAGSRSRYPYATLGGTILKWAGPEGGTLFQVYACSRSRFSDFMLEGNVTTGGGSPNLPPGLPKAGVGLDYRGNNATSAVSTGNMFENISVFGCDIGVRIAGDPIAYSSGGGGDQADMTEFRNVHVRECPTSFQHFSNQAVQNRFYGCSSQWFTRAGFDSVTGSPCLTTHYFGTSDSCVTAETRALHVGGESFVTVDGLGHWELAGGCPALVWDGPGPELMVMLVRQNFLVGRPDLKRPLIVAQHPGKLFIDMCRFDASLVGGVNYLKKPEFALPIVIVPPCELVMRECVTRMGVTIV